MPKLTVTSLTERTGSSVGAGREQAARNRVAQNRAAALRIDGLSMVRRDDGLVTDRSDSKLLTRWLVI